MCFRVAEILYIFTVLAPVTLDSAEHRDQEPGDSPLLPWIPTLIFSTRPLILKCGNFFFCPRRFLNPATEWTTTDSSPYISFSFSASLSRSKLCSEYS